MYLKVPEDLYKIERNTYYAIAKDYGDGYEVGGFCLGEYAHDKPERFEDKVLTLVPQENVMDMMMDL